MSATTATYIISAPVTTGSSTEYRRVAALPAHELDAIMQRGEAPDLDALVGWEWRGTNTPQWAALVGIWKFIKGFWRRADGQVFGYNIPARQGPRHDPWLPLPDPEQPRRFGFYRVDPVDPTARDNAYLDALLLDYSRGGGPALDPSRTLRDYLVRVEHGSDELLLGKAYVALGPLRVPTSFFVLERLRPSEWQGPAGDT